MNTNARRKHRYGYMGVLAALVVLLALGATARIESGASAAPADMEGLILPGDGAIGPAAGTQEDPQIVAGGSGYLAVWEDSRTNWAEVHPDMLPSGGEVSGQTLRDIYAARLDANGNVIDSVPIVVSQATWSQTAPQVAWNGQNWLVVFNTQRVSNFSSTVDVVGVRISPGGQVLDNPPIPIDDHPTIDTLWPTVASDGTNWVVVWMDQGNYFELDATRISPEGAVLDPGGVAIHTPGFPDAPYNAAITFTGGQYLLVWSGDNTIQGMRLTPTLQRTGNIFNITSVPGNFPEVSGNGTDFFVAFQGDFSVYGARVTAGGQVLDPAGINISGQNGGYPLPDVGWDGTQWWVTWVPYSNNTMAARVSTSGQLLDPNGIMVSGTSYVSAIVGRPSGGAFAVWADSRLAGNGRWDIFRAPISAGGQPGEQAAVSLGAPSQIRPEIASNGTGYLSVFLSNVSGQNRIKGQRLDAAGNAIDQEPFLIESGPGLGRPRIAWNGTLYLVVWSTANTIVGKRVSVNGQVLDATPIAIMGTLSGSPDVAALNGQFLVVSLHVPQNHVSVVRAIRVGGDGVVIGSPTIVGSSFAQEPRVEALGNRYLLVFERYPTHDNPYSAAWMNFINADGTGVGDFAFGTNGVIPVKTPYVVVGENQALLVYFGRQPPDVTQGDIFARRILPDGTFLDPDPGIHVTTAPNAQFFAAGAWTGSEYVVVYEDYRAVAYLDRPVSDIYGTRVTAGGQVLDPNGFPIANDFVPEVTPAIAALPGSYVIAFSHFMHLAPYGAYRIEVEHGTAGSPPTPGPTRTPTITPTITPPSCVAGNYVIASSGGAAIVPGTVDVGNHCDECATEITLPFAFALYDQTFSSVQATANGTLNFVDSGRTGGINFCLPYSGLGYSILPYWDDMMTSGQGHGIFTSISGSAPNRIFNIEWRTCDWGGGGQCGSGSFNFEARLYESTNQFEIIYGQMSGNGSSSTVGVQKDTGQRYTQYACNTGGITQGLKLSFALNNCGTPTVVPTSGPPTNTPTRTATVPPGSTATPTHTSMPATATRTATTVAASVTPGGPTATATTTPIACQVSFTDVEPGSTFYQYVMCLACRDIVSGYSDGTFRPGNPVTRGQLSKIVSNAAGFSDPVSGQSFEDVAPGSTFYEYVERLASRGIIAGYACGGASEPCGVGNLPYFRPGAGVTRGQTAKIVAIARGLPNPPAGQQTFADVPEGSTFWTWIEALSSAGAISGYPCGGAGEPCDTQNRPYFRPGNGVTRGQSAKIVSVAFFPQCSAP